MVQYSLFMKYFIKTFGCQANKADSERIASWLKEQGMKPSKKIEQADYIVINTCMVRESAENRVYGLVNNLTKFKNQSFDKLRIDPEQSRMGQNSKIRMPKIIVTGCMVGMAVRDKSGQFMRKIRNAMPVVDEFLPIEEIGFDHKPIRTEKIHAWVPISNGCNNFCTYCVVPFTRGREVSRPFKEIINEVKQLAKQGYSKITLLGQNVNSYGADIIISNIKNQKSKTHLKIKNLDFNENLKFKIENYDKKPVYVRHLGRYRIPTLFPYLLEDICKINGIKKVDFMSSNPWDFSDELIKVIQKNKKITRNIHLPVQSGDNEILKRMNRWYTAEQYLALISKIKNSFDPEHSTELSRSPQDGQKSKIKIN